MIALIAFLPMLVIAQAEIDQSSLPQAGWTYIVSNDATTTYNVSGSSLTLPQIWNYSNLNDEYQKVPTYDSTSFTPYASEFPTSIIYTYGPAVLYSGLFGAAPVGQQQFTKGYMFWRNDDTGF